MSDGNHALPGRAIRAALGGGLGDGQLLGRYLWDRDHAAFEALVRRHGPMVLAVCRRVTGHEQDAEDAFQATFVVLARKAAEVDPREQVGNWLYGVAYRTAQKARARACRRRALERRAAEARSPMDMTDGTWDDHGLLLHQELARLPTIYRVPIVLCDLEGRFRSEVATQLGIPEGTLSSRLTAGRQRLLAALTRRGVVLSAGGLVTLLAGTGRVGGAVPPSLVEATVRAIAAGGRLEAVAPRVLELADASARALASTRLKVAGLLLAAATAAGAGAAGFVLGGRDPVPPPPTRPLADEPVRAARPEEEGGVRRQIESGTWWLRAVDPGRRTLAVADSPTGNRVVAVPGGSLHPAGISIQGLPVGADARVELDGQPAGFESLRTGMQVSLRLGPGDPAVVRVVAVSGKPFDPTSKAAAYEVTAFDPTRGVMSVRDPTTRQELNGLPLAPGLEVEVLSLQTDPGVSGTARPGAISDVKPGMRIALGLAVGADGRLAVRKVTAPK